MTRAKEKATVLRSTVIHVVAWDTLHVIVGMLYVLHRLELPHHLPLQ